MTQRPEDDRDGPRTAPSFLTHPADQHALGAIQELFERHAYEVVTCNIAGQIQFWSRSAAKMFGYTVEEIVGSSSMVLTPPEGMAEASRWRKGISKGEILERQEMICLRKDGTRVHVCASVYPMRDAQQQIIGTWSLLRDITEEKLAQDRASAMPAKMAEVRDEERGRIARNLQDGIGQLLAALTSNVQSLARHRSALSPDRLDSVLDDILTLVEEVSHEIRVHLKAISQGDPYRPSGPLQQQPDRSPTLASTPFAVLTKRELEMAALLAKGRSNKEAASDMGISVKTAETHRARIMRKLKLRCFAELVHLAMATGLIKIQKGSHRT